MICFINNKINTRNLTNYMCSYCDIPVCPHNYYDKHRREEN